MRFIGQYLMNVLRLLDQAINCLILFGAPDETISERAAKARNNGREWGCILCRFLDWVSPGHCDDALTSVIGEDAIIPDGE